jgi:ATP-dependent helicase STH1/SNF2
MQRFTTSYTATDILDIKSGLKKSALRSQRPLERDERYMGATGMGAQKMDRHRKERQKHLELVNSILEKGREFFNFHRTYNSQKINKLARGILHVHANAEKEEIKRLDRLAKERISALKADDEEAYLKLIDAQKDTRLTHLIRQTDLYLESLTSMVQMQKKEASFGLVDSEMSNDHHDDDDEFSSTSTSKVDYYSTAHKINEAITSQPSILIGGQVKRISIKRTPMDDFSL